MKMKQHLPKADSIFISDTSAMSHDGCGVSSPESKLESEVSVVRNRSRLESDRYFRFLERKGDGYDVNILAGANLWS